jgi:hypothetical protein
MQVILRILCFSILFAASIHTASAALPGGISGHWYNPDQPGHGLSVTLAEPGFAVVVWHVFDPDGKPVTLYIEGDVVGRTIEGIAYAPVGMRFGTFDPAQLQAPQWGTVEMSFDDCVHATLQWNASDPAFGSGSMPLERLAFTEGLDCELPPIEPEAVQRYSGDVIRNGDSATAAPLVAIVDPSGRLWGIERLTYPIPSPMWAGARVHQVVRLDPPQADGTVSGTVERVWWTQEENLREGRNALGSWPDGQAGGEALWQFGDDVFELSWSPADDARSLVAPVNAQVLAGRYAVPMSDQNPGDTNAWLEIESDGRACVEMSPWYAPAGGCHFEGSIHAPDGEFGLIEFEFQRPAESPGTPHRGKGWLTDGPDGLELILVGDGGFGLMAYPES